MADPKGSRPYMPGYGLLDPAHTDARMRAGVGNLAGGCGLVQLEPWIPQGSQPCRQPELRHHH